MGMRRAAALLSNVGVLLNTCCLTTGARCRRLRLLQIDLSGWGVARSIVVSHWRYSMSVRGSLAFVAAGPELCEGPV
jgi:hypothetical protein